MTEREAKTGGGPNPPGAALARKLCRGLTEAGCWLPRAQAGDDPLVRTFDQVATVFQEAFEQGDNLVCIMAAGIVVRGIAPHLRGKDPDPAVVVVDEAGKFAISLLSGHLGGANQLARLVAQILKGTPVITTATDVQGLPALDLAAVRAGLTIENLAGGAPGANGAPVRPQPAPGGPGRLPGRPGSKSIPACSLAKTTWTRPWPAVGPGSTWVSGSAPGPSLVDSPAQEPGARHGMPPGHPGRGDLEIHREYL